MWLKIEFFSNAYLFLEELKALLEIAFGSSSWRRASSWTTLLGLFSSSLVSFFSCLCKFELGAKEMRLQTFLSKFFSRKREFSSCLYCRFSVVYGKRLRLKIQKQLVRNYRSIIPTWKHNKLY